MSGLAINGRFRHQKMTGIQRVAESITSRLRTPHTVIEPERLCEGLKGHAWEQFVLPFRAGDKLIWGPCNTGPAVAKSQILTIHGAAVFDHPEWFSPAFVRMNQTLWPLLAKRARKIVTVSHFSRDRISEVLSLPKNRIEVIWNGVDKTFQPAPREAIDRATASVGLTGRPYFATLSTIEPRKNLSLVLRAWKKQDRTCLRIFSSSSLAEKGKKDVFSKANKLPSNDIEGVIFSGYVAEEMLPPLLSGAYGALYPSIYEGFGLPVLEAMACGTPAVTTCQTSLPEVGGEAALYVDPEDPNDLAATLINLASSAGLRMERAAMGLERAKLFTWDEAAARMDGLFARYM